MTEVPVWFLLISTADAMKFLTFLLPLSEPTHFFQLVLKKKKKKVCLMARVLYFISVSKITVYTYFFPFNINVDGFDSFQG